MQEDNSRLNTGQGYDEFHETGSNDLSQSSRATGASIKQKARETKDQLKDKGNEAMHQARDRTRAFAEERKSQLGERIHGYGSAVHRAAEKLRDEKDPNIAHYAEMVAERLDQAADYVQSRDPGAMLRDLENAARRRPEIFFGGMFVAGLVLSRFLKASSERDQSSGQYEYDSSDAEDYWVEEPYAEDTEMSGTAMSDTTMPGESFASTSTEGGEWKPSNQTGGNI